MWPLSQGPWLSCSPSHNTHCHLPPLPPTIPGADLVPSSRRSVLCRHYAWLWADWKVKNNTAFLIRGGIFLPFQHPVCCTSADFCFHALQTPCSSPQLPVCLLKPNALRPSLRKTSSAEPSLVNAALARAFLYIQGPCLEVYNLNLT